MSAALVPLVWIPGEPKGQPRPRAFAFKGKARVYNPGTAEAFKGAVALAVRPFLPAQPIECPLSVRLFCHFQRPKSHYTKKGLRPTAPVHHTSTPDADNVLKSVCDALTGVGLWRDDSQVARAEIRKEYGDTPGCWLEVRVIEETTA